MGSKKNEIDRRSLVYYHQRQAWEQKNRKSISCQAHQVLKLRDRLLALPSQQFDPIMGLIDKLLLDYEKQKQDQDGKNKKSQTPPPGMSEFDLDSE